MTGSRALAGTAMLTVVALFAVGLALSLFTGRQALRGALRMVLIGGGAGAVAFWVGRALGALIH
jgi:VIT1/CCC1 family predicted Fe2+/Mn2+ transporter